MDEAPPGTPSAPSTPPVVLSARGIRKSFSGVEVLHGVDFTLHAGEVHGMVGQNGAGKSTLVKIINGAYSADAGEIEVHGSALHRAAATGPAHPAIAMVYQEFSLIPTMTVAQNVYLGREPKGRTRLIDDDATRRATRAALARVGADIDPDRLVEDLPVGSRQLVEIAKAISQEASILILDEPTASLAAAEIQALAGAVDRLTAEGITVVFISHHLNEVMQLCDRVTVLRDGRVTLSAPIAEVTLASMIEGMLGQSLESALAYQPRAIDRTGIPLLRVAGLANGRLHDVSFDLYAGEILGIAGLLGSGKSELLRAVYGIDPVQAGTIELDGRRVVIRSPANALAAGIALVPEDRARAGLVREHSVGDNILMAAWNRYARAGLVDDRAAIQAASSFVDQLHIQVRGLSQMVKTLSGGNQQKVVVAKNLSVSPRVLLLDDPTVGVDVGSKREILTYVRALAAAGTGVILVSSELEELSGLADRVLVMRGGTARSLLDRAGSALSQEQLSRAIQG